MSPLEPLAPDQRAVVALILQQGRSYDEIAALLGIPVDAVRARAHAGLGELEPGNGLPGEITGPLADYLLGQQTERDAEATRGLLAESAPARAWATGVAERLAPVAPQGLPEIPGGAPASAASPTVAEPTPDREPPPPPGGGPTTSSRVGGALLIAGVVAVVSVVLFLVLRGGGDDPGGAQVAASATPTAGATPTPTPSAVAPQVADTIPLRASGGQAKGTMTVYLQDDRLLFELVADGLEPGGTSSAYAVWLTGPGDKARRLGFATVAEDGGLGIQGPAEKDLAAFPRLFATYANVVVSRESRQDTRRPSTVVLSGKLPSGR